MNPSFGSQSRRLTLMVAPFSPRTVLFSSTEARSVAQEIMMQVNVIRVETPLKTNQERAK
jgi:hypothetical protein